MHNQHALKKYILRRVKSNLSNNVYDELYKNP